MRPAKTRRQHLLQNTLPQGKPERPSTFVGGRPKIPAHLSPVARKEFKRCVHLLEQRGTVTEGDYALLTVYSTVFARWLQAKTEIGDELMVQYTTLDSHGKQVTVRRLNPLLKIVTEAEKQLLSLVKSLGLTPDTREKVKQVGEGGDPEIVVPGTVAYLIAQAQLEDASNVIPIAVPPQDITFDEEESQ
jgi:P27 family predicted phage terminase small subunit